MDPSCLEDEPNKVAEAYRNYRPIAVPFEVEKYLDFIDISEGQYFIHFTYHLDTKVTTYTTFCAPNINHFVFLASRIKFNKV